MGAISNWKKLLERGNSSAFSFVLAVLSISIVLILYYTQNSFLEAFEAKTYDLRFKIMRGPIQPSPNIGGVSRSMA